MFALCATSVLMACETGMPVQPTRAASVSIEQPSNVLNPGFIAVGEVQQLTAIAVFDNGAAGTTSAAVDATWSQPGGGPIELGGAGRITGLEEGSATIRAQTDMGSLNSGSRLYRVARTSRRDWIKS